MLRLYVNNVCFFCWFFFVLFFLREIYDLEHVITSEMALKCRKPQVIIGPCLRYFRCRMSCKNDSRKKTTAVLWERKWIYISWLGMVGKTRSLTLQTVRHSSQFISWPWFSPVSHSSLTNLLFPVLFLFFFFWRVLMGDGCASDYGCVWLVVAISLCQLTARLRMSTLSSQM